MKIIFDQLDIKNTIGKEIANIVKKGVKLSTIVSPYVSGLREIIDIEKIDKIKIICNAESSSCNPFTLHDLINSGKIQIKSRNDIHAKVYRFDNVGFVTSANATPNGLGIGSIEVATKVTSERSINEIRSWFNTIWEDSQSKDISGYSEEKWQKLKSSWELSINNKNTKPTLYDLIITKNLPKNTSFIFWGGSEDILHKDSVETKAKKEHIVELPDNNEHWGFWIDREDYQEQDGSFDLIGTLLQKYYNHTMISLKKYKNSEKVVEAGNFVCKLLDKPIVLKQDNRSLLIVLYRIDNIECDFKVDQRSIKLINHSQSKNSSEWEKYLKSDEGIYGYCTSEQLYKLVIGCV